MNEKRKPGGMVQRCIIIHRDEHGFGLTVSGDNPVFVQSIKPGSAAEKAGVQVQDQIIKVNGATVTKSNHLEVVKLIRSGSFVALTLLGKDNSKSPDTGPRPGSGRHSRSHSDGAGLGGFNTNPSSPPADSKKNDSKVNDLKRSLATEHENYKKLLDEYMRTPSQKSQQELADLQMRIHTLEQQIKSLTGSIPPKPPGLSVLPGFGSNKRSSSQDRILSNQQQQQQNHQTSIRGNEKPNYENGGIKLSSKLQHSQSSASVGSTSKQRKLQHSASSVSLTTNNNKRPTMDEEDGHNFPFTVPAPVGNIDDAISSAGYSFDDLFTKAKEDNLNPLGPSTLAGANIISMEDDEFDSDEERFNDHGPFVDMSSLKDKPAHLSVFLHYLILNSNPVPLLFWLVTGVYSQEIASGKELRKWAYEIYSTFVHPGAPLKVKISEPEEKAVEIAFTDVKTSDERMRKVFDVARSIIYIEVNEQLADFRNKRALGLGGLFGDQQLEDKLDKNKELNVIHQTLTPHFEALLREDSNMTNEQIERSQAMASSLATFLKQTGVSKKQLEGCRSFMEKEKTFKIKKKMPINNHQFVPSQFSNITICNFCNKIISGIGNQGYQCTTCDFIVHRKKCIESLQDNCPGKKVHDKSGTDNSEENNDPNKKTDKPFIQTTEENITGSKKTSGGTKEQNDKKKTASLTGVGKSPGVYGPKPFNLGGAGVSDATDSEEDESDSDLEVETEAPNWQTTVVDKKILKKLKSKEIKRQEVIHELIHTERTHVRNLKVLNKIFYKPLLKENIIPKETVELIFPNLEQLIEIHVSLLKPMKELVRKQEVVDKIGDIMLERFEGENGIKVREACAFFCRSQKYALQQLKKLQFSKKEVQTFMAKQESHEYCERRQFTDIMAASHQRLVKYPLLLDNICKSTPAAHLDLKNVEKCSQCCRDILNYVNEEIKIAEDKLRLEELSRKIEDKRGNKDKDTEDDKTKEGDGKFEIASHKLMCEGDLLWKINPTKSLNLHVVLLDDFLVLLQSADGGKYILKNHSTTLGATSDNRGHSPIIKLSNIIIRDVATDKTAFFLVSTSLTGPQIYELYARSSADKKRWVTNINQVADIMKGKDANAGRGRRDGLTATTTMNTSSPGGERKPTVTKQNISVDDEEPPKPTNLPSPERLEELRKELFAKEEEIKKAVEEKMKIIAEMRGEIVSKQKDEKPSNIPEDPRELLLSASEHATRLSEAVNSLITLNKDNCSPELRNTLNESSTSVNEHILTLIQYQDKNTKTLIGSEERDKRIRLPIKQLSESASSQQDHQMHNHLRSHSLPVGNLELSEIQSDEIDETIESVNNEEIDETKDSVDGVLSHEGHQTEQQNPEESNLLILTNPVMSSNASNENETYDV